MGLSMSKVVPRRTSPLPALLVVLYGCGFLAGFNENLVNMALVDIMGDFSLDAVTAQWLVTGYMIAVTVVVACMACLYRRFPLRRLFFAASALSIAGSAGGLVAPGFLTLMLARLVQAVGTGMYIPLMMNVIIDEVPSEKLGSRLAIGSCMITMGPASAPIVTGFLVSNFGWRSVFAVPFAAGVVLVAAGAFVVRSHRKLVPAPFDVLSAALVAGGVTLLSMGLAELTARPLIGVAEMVGACVAFAWFARRQQRLESPLVSLEPLRRRAFRPAVVLVMVAMITYFSLSVMVPLYFEEAAGLAASVSGVLLLIPVLAHATASVLSGRALDRAGEWPLLPAGLGVAVLGLALAVAGALHECVPLVTIGVLGGYWGTGMVLSPAQTAGLRRLPDEMNPYGVAIMNMALQLAACLGPAAYIGIMSSASAHAVALGAPAAVASATGFAWAMTAALAVALAGCLRAFTYARRMARK